MPEAEPNPLQPAHFRRADESADSIFYQQPRLVTHIDDEAIASLTAFYREVLVPGTDILDLMSSWVSHLPDDVPFNSITGLGMNAVELDSNPRLTRRVVHDLNEQPRLPFDDQEFDACLLAVSVQYLVQPVEVFKEIGRVLKPGSPCVVSYSNRCFPTKAIAAWQMLDDRGHAELIGLYFRLSEVFDAAEGFQLRPDGATDPMFAVLATRIGLP